jgi:hypothetical protein
VYQAVHSDRSGRVFVSADYGATALDGRAPVPLESAIAVPADTELVPLADRAAMGLDRRGEPRSLGPTRWAVAALLPPGYVRTHLPSIDAASDVAPLEPLPYSAVAADSAGELVVAAAQLGAPTVANAQDLGRAITRRRGAEPSTVARNAFLGQGECALPLGAPANDAAAPLVALRRHDERAPLEPSAFRVTPADAAAVGIAHLAAGGSSVSFGHACEGEPLDAIRDVADAVARIRAASPAGAIVLRTSGSSAAAIGRAADAGIDRVVVRLVSAAGPTYEQVHRPIGFRWTDVRAALREAAARRCAITVELLSLPGLSDREREAGALVALLGELPPGTELRLADLAADPYALLATLPAAATIGIARLLERLRADAAHVRLAA